MMMAAFFKALFAGIVAAFRDWRIDRDYRESVIENTRRDEEDRIRAGVEATRRRVQDVTDTPMGDDPGILRDWLRSRDPNNH